MNNIRRYYCPTCDLDFKERYIDGRVRCRRCHGIAKRGSATGGPCKGHRTTQERRDRLRANQRVIRERLRLSRNK